jgi:hypothetical protein
VGAVAGAGVDSAGVPWVDLTVRIWNVPVDSAVVGLQMGCFVWAGSWAMWKGEKVER